MEPAEREVEHFRKFWHGIRFDVMQYIRESWECGSAAGELTDEDLAYVYRFLVGRVISAGGGAAALARLRRDFTRAHTRAGDIAPGDYDHDPELWTEWYETEGGYYVDGGYIFNSEGYEVLERDYVEEWVTALESFLRTLIGGFAGDAYGAPIRGRLDWFACLTDIIARILSDSRRNGPGGHLSRREPVPLHHREGVAPIQRTGPPSRTWASIPQVLPAAA